MEMKLGTHAYYIISMTTTGGLFPFTEVYVVVYKNEWIQVNLKLRQDRDGIDEAWLMNIFEHADTPDPITQSL